ncbi:Alpha-amylase [Caenispirillum salinarum AK4]|uniref:Alpha-1,4-glucan:maltose-1-phosphate maltosyltransferase n=1 Tax=Caenispirillum salinarum AK4 TaxID=1238182 RepID=K9GT98_9PROT|nr:alpha-1,4-glucan--maltose-1-phosphate maltosyltransferase [Caenispirillum salinarum]EKV28412.1 Alpha-amylase [Caenispirillum salinarum AK4]
MAHAETGEHHRIATPEKLAGAVRSRSIVIQNVRPEVDGGRYAVKREVGDALTVDAEIFKDGHAKIAAVLKVKRYTDAADQWTELPMELVNPGLDAWRASIVLPENTRYVYTIEAWDDPWATWEHDIGKKIEAGQDVNLEVIEGRKLIDEAKARAAGTVDDDGFRMLIERMEAAPDTIGKAEVMRSAQAHDLMNRWPDRSRAIAYDRELEVMVDPVRARYAAWYEMAPRSQGTDPNKSATFDDCIKRLPEIREMGFDVVYLLPIHPIGKVNRKGKNNSVTAEPGEPGSPYAIGSDEGGHKAVHPELGTEEDFRRFVAEAKKLGMEVAMDIAVQCAPDHPWIKEHPDWFEFRPDGTIRYAENPPKKYQDIVNVNFYGGHQMELWEELRTVFEHWVDCGVTIFRVDNPHTKPVPFWEWVIRQVKDKHPEVIFLSEAFTRPTMLHMLAKVGFSQSYTYFTWRNFRHELEMYLTELTQGPGKEYLRPNFFPTTPDILPEFLQRGGRPAHMIRLVLAATTSSVYGMYNGYELIENTPVPGKEEFLDSEKYQYKVRDWDAPGNIKDYVTELNEIRAENPALHELENLRFHGSSDQNVIFYGKRTFDDSNMIFVAVNLDPFEPHSSILSFPLEELGIGPEDAFAVEELFSGTRRLWHGADHEVTLDPQDNPAMIFRITRWKQVDYYNPSY